MLLLLLLLLLHQAVDRSDRGVYGDGALHASIDPFDRSI
jgi:hypothetical protein